MGQDTSVAQHRPKCVTKHARYDFDQNDTPDAFKSPQCVPLVLCRNNNMPFTCRLRCAVTSPASKRPKARLLSLIPSQSAASRRRSLTYLTPPIDNLSYDTRSSVFFFRVVVYFCPTSKPRGPPHKIIENAQEDRCLVDCFTHTPHFNTHTHTHAHFQHTDNTQTTQQQPKNNNTNNKHHCHPPKTS
jgi:hypothetical protein